MQDIHYAQFLAESLYGIDILPEDFEEMALIAFRMIGNKRTQLMSTCLRVDCNGLVQLPCDCDMIEAVTWGFEDWNNVSNKQWFGELVLLFLGATPLSFLGRFPITTTSGNYPPSIVVTPELGLFCLGIEVVLFLVVVVAFAVGANPLALTDTLVPSGFNIQSPTLASLSKKT